MTEGIKSKYARSVTFSPKLAMHKITEPPYARGFLKFNQKKKKPIKSPRHKRQGGKPKGNLSKQSITENKLSTTVLLKSLTISIYTAEKMAFKVIDMIH